jgi:hypothetical protein
MLNLVIPKCKNGHFRTPDNITTARSCKQCVRETARKWGKENPERRRLQPSQQARYKREVANKRPYNVYDMLYSRYRLRKYEFIALLKAQEGRCAICLDEFVDKITPYVDHDHNTKRVRGLLCKKCNSGLGLLRDSTELLARALAYLTR